MMNKFVCQLMKYQHFIDTERLVLGKKVYNLGTTSNFPYFVASSDEEK